MKLKDSIEIARFKRLIICLRDVANSTDERKTRLTLLHVAYLMSGSPAMFVDALSARAAVRWIKASKPEKPAQV